MAVTVDQAMSDLGAGSVSPQDFLKALSASIVDAVGPAKKYGSGPSEDKKQAEEQLKKMKELTDGLEDLTKAVEDVQKVIKDAKKNATATKSDFSNLSTAMNRLADNMKNVGGPGGDKKTMDNLNKMAKESVTGHSLHVHDFTVAAKMDTLINQVKNLAAIMAGSKGKGGKGSKSTGGGSIVVDDDVGKTGLGGSGKMGSGDAMGGSNDLSGGGGTLNSASKMMSKLSSSSEKWAKKLKIEKKEMDAILAIAGEMTGEDEEQLISIEKVLDHMGQLNQYDKKRVQAALERYRAMKKEEASLDKQNQLMGEFVAEVINAGENIKLHLSDTLAKIQSKYLEPMHRLISTISPANFGLGGGAQGRDRLNLNPADMVRNTNDWIANVGQLSMALGTIGDITKPGHAGQEMLHAFRNADAAANELMMDVMDVRKEMERLGRRGFRTGQQMADMARTGLGLGRMIGANAEATSDELASWTQNFGLSATRARVLSTEIQAIGRSSVASNTNLLQAVRSARALAEQMRNTGSFTDQANASLIQFSAVARRMGSETATNPLLQILGNFDTNNPLAPMMMQMATRAGVNPQDVLNSNILGTANQQPMIDALTELRDQLMAQRASGVPLNAINRQLSSRGYGQGLGAFDLAVRTMQQGGGGAGQGGQSPLAVLQSGGRAGAGGNLAPVMREIAANGDARAANEDYNELRARGIAVSNLQELETFAGQSNENFQRVVDALAALQERRVSETQRGTDPATAARAAIIAFQNAAQRMVDNGILRLYESVSAQTIATTALTIAVTEAALRLGMDLFTLGQNITSLIVALGANSLTNLLGGGGPLAMALASGGPLIIALAALTAGIVVWNRYQALNRHHEEMVRNAATTRAANTATRTTELATINASTDPNVLRTTITALDAEVQTQNVLMDRLQNQIRGATIADDLAGRTAAWRAEEEGTRTGLQQLIDNAAAARARLAAIAPTAPAPAPRVDLPPVVLAPNERILTTEEATQRGLPALPAGDAHIERAPTRMENLNNRFRTGMTRVFGDWGFADGTREIQNTGLAVLHQGEMVVPEAVVRSLGAEGNGPFDTGMATVRPASNDALMRHRIQTEFGNDDSDSYIAQASDTLNDLHSSSQEQTILMKQEIAILREMLAVWSGAEYGDTSTNSRPTPPANYHNWAVRPLNSPSYGGIENYTRG